MQQPLLILAVTDCVSLLVLVCHRVVVAAIIINIIHTLHVVTSTDDGIFYCKTEANHSSYGSTASSTCASTINISWILKLH